VEFEEAAAAAGAREEAAAIRDWNLIVFSFC
jgi:hypothetical protein